jgi:tRNA-binding protein
MAIGEQKPKITFGKFQNIDMRVALVRGVQDASGTRFPCKVLHLDLGPLGDRRSVGQFALIDDAELLGSKVVACINLGEREMGSHVSQALVLGTPHPDGPADQAQAIPLRAHPLAEPGDAVF